MVERFSAHASFAPESSRREFLARTGVLTSTLLAGCGDRIGSDGSRGESDTIEIMVENRSSERAVIGVRVEDDDGKALFTRVYELESGHLDSSAGIETPPESVIAFTPEGASRAWRYAPDPDAECDGEDIGITLRSDGSIESWYAC